MVHTECAHEKTAVVASQCLIERPDAFCFQLQKNGINELHHIISLQLWPQAMQTEQIAQCVPRVCGGAAYVYVARIVFPSVAVRNHGYAVSQCSESRGQTVVHIAVFANEKYLHVRCAEGCLFSSGDKSTYFPLFLQ